MMRTATFAAIVAVFAVVLSLAAPVAVDAQTWTVTDPAYGNTQFTATGLNAGATYYRAFCYGQTAFPAACTSQRVNSCSDVGSAQNDGNMVFTHGRGWAVGDFSYVRHELFSDSSCGTLVVSINFRVPDPPRLVARDVSETSARLDLEGAFSAHKLAWWNYKRDPGGVCTLGATDRPATDGTPNPILSGLQAGTTYTYDAFLMFFDDDNDPTCDSHHFGRVTFTTLGGDGSAPPGPPPPDPPSGVDGGEPTTAVSGGSVTLSWSNPGDSSIASYEYSIRQAGGAAGEWRTVPGSNADTTSVTIDLATGAAVAVNNATPPMVEWTIHLRARDVDGNAGGIFTTTVAASAGEMVPALPLAGLAMLALFLFMSGQRQRKGG